MTALGSRLSPESPFGTQRAQSAWWSAERRSYRRGVIPESHADLLAGAFTGIVTTVGADGFPQSSAMWFMWEDGSLWFSTKRWAVKFRNVVARPEVSFIVVDPADEFRTVEIRGTATVGEDPGCVGRDRIRAKHGLPPDAPDPAADARVLVTVVPTRVIVHGAAPSPTPESG